MISHFISFVLLSNRKLEGRPETLQIIMLSDTCVKGVSLSFSTLWGALFHGWNILPSNKTLEKLYKNTEKKGGFQLSNTVLEDYVQIFSTTLPF